MKEIKTIMLILIMLYISGCQPVQTIKDVDPSNLGDEQGLLIFSTTANDLCYLTAYQMNLKEYGKSAMGFTALYFAYVNNPHVKSDFNDSHTKVHTVLVKPGEYDFWLDNAMGTAIYTGKIATDKITVNAGEILYLGEIYQEKGCRGTDVNAGYENNFGYPKPELNDRFERDINFIINNSNLSDDNAVTKRLLNIIYPKTE